MTADNLLVLGILAIAVVLFVSEKLRVDVVAMIGTPPNTLASSILDGYGDIEPLAPTTLRRRTWPC